MRTEDILRCLISFALFSSLLLWVEVCHVFGNPNARHPVTNEKLTANCFKARGQITCGGRRCWMDRATGCSSWRTS